MSAQDYNHQEIEKKWQNKWAEQDLYKVEDKIEGKENYYTLFEFPYPSGNLHVGHWYAYAPTDVIARYERMNGKNVLLPIGFDSFGLPAENAAIKRGLDPREWTYKNIDTMTDQIKSIGTAVDWSREVRTSDPEYYKWTQYIFTKFLENGLAYEDEIEVNYCPSCKTILANEQVVAGHCKRCSYEIEKRSQKQWMLKITDYADQLLDDLDQLDWPQEIKAAQRAWIGKSEGAKFKFEISNKDLQVEVFTTRPDTFYGATYLVLAPEHPLINNLGVGHLNNWEEVQDYVKRSKVKSDIERQENREKTGVLLDGVTAKHPATGEELPIFVADYVLGSYGTGAVMAVPAHDERDFEFANKYDLPIKQVVSKVFIYGNWGEDELSDAKRSDGSYGLIFDIEGNVLLQNFPAKDKNGLVKYEYRLPGGGLDQGESFEEGLFREIDQETEYKFISHRGNLGSVNTFYVTPFGKEMGAKFVREKRLFKLNISDAKKSTLTCEDYEINLEYKWFKPVEALEIMSKNVIFDHEYFLLKQALSQEVLVEKGMLIDSENFDGLTSEEAGQKIAEEFGEVATTYRLRDWSVGRQRYWGCPIPVVYDPDGKPHPVPHDKLPWLLPDDVDHTPDGTAPLARSKELRERTQREFGEGWTPAVDTMDTFVDSSWYYLRYLNPRDENQLVTNDQQQSWMPVDFYSGGAEHTTMHLLYSRFFYKAMHDCGLVTGDEPYKKRLNRSLILGPDGNKMSKSKGNVIDPDQQVVNVGADAIRMYLCFVGPYNQVSHYPWDPNGLVGIRKFLERVNGLSEYLTEEINDKVEVALNQVIKSVTESIDQHKLNTGVSSMMIFANVVAEQKSITETQLKTFIRLLAPYVPHLAEEWWSSLGSDLSVHSQSWPEFDDRLLNKQKITLPVQLNGKKIGEIQIDQEADQDTVLKAIKSSEMSNKIDFSAIKKAVFVPKRIINLVVDNKD